MNQILKKIYDPVGNKYIYWNTVGYLKMIIEYLHDGNQSFCLDHYQHNFQMVDEFSSTYDSGGNNIGLGSKKLY